MRQRACATAMLAIATACQPRPAPPLQVFVAPADLGSTALRHATNLTAFGPRHTGSKGWQRSVDYIVRQLRKIGYPPRVDRWEDSTERLRFTNVHATLPGATEDKIVIGCHHDTKCTVGHDDPANNFHFTGANDSASGVGLLLALAAALRTTTPDATLEFVFFDGEESIPFEWDLSRALFGSRRYVAEYRARRAVGTAEPAIRAFILLDCVGAADLQIDRETRSDPRLHAIVERAAAACGHSEYFFAESLDVTDDHVPFLREGIPSIDLIDLANNPEWHTPNDTIDRLSARSLQIVGEVVLTALPEVTKRFVPRRRAR